MVRVRILAVFVALLAQHLAVAAISPPLAGSVAPPSELSYPSPVTATLGKAIPELKPTVKGTVSRFTVTPILPTGLTLNSETGVISGTPEIGAARIRFTIAAANSAGSTKFELSLAVNAALPLLTVTATSLTFPSQLISTTSAEQLVGIVNTGSEPLTVLGTLILSSGIYMGRADWFHASIGDCHTLAPNATCIVRVTFTPRGNGPAEATLNILSDKSSLPSKSSASIQFYGQGSTIGLAFENPIVPAGKPSTLKWSAPGLSDCKASGRWSGSMSASGSISVLQIVPGYYTYTLTCGDYSSSAILTVSGPTPSVKEPKGELAWQARFYVAPPNQFVSFETSLKVPPLPPVPTARGSALFLWPGLDPAGDSENFLPINNGVIQPVLSWGNSCAPVTQPDSFSNWWISGQYVNTFGNFAGYKGCFSGNSMVVHPGDLLLLAIRLNPYSDDLWTEVVTDATTSESVTFGVNLHDQGQNWAYFALEEWFAATIDTPVTFENTTITFNLNDTENWCSGSQVAEEDKYTMTMPTLMDFPPTDPGNPQDAPFNQCYIQSVLITQPSSR